MAGFSTVIIVCKRSCQMKKYFFWNRKFSSSTRQKTNCSQTHSRNSMWRNRSLDRSAREKASLSKVWIWLQLHSLLKMWHVLVFEQRQKLFQRLSCLKHVPISMISVARILFQRLKRIGFDTNQYTFFCGFFYLYMYSNTYTIHTTLYMHTCIYTSIFSLHVFVVRKWINRKM